MDPITLVFLLFGSVCLIEGINNKEKKNKEETEKEDMSQLVTSIKLFDNTPYEQLNNQYLIRPSLSLLETPKVDLSQLIEYGKYQIKIESSMHSDSILGELGETWLSHRFSDEKKFDAAIKNTQVGNGRKLKLRIGK